MEVEVPRPEMHPVFWRNRRQIGQHAVLEVEDLERSGIGWIIRRRVIAARHQYDARIIRRRSDLMSENAGVELSRLFDLFADRTHGIDAMNRHSGGIVVGDQQKMAGTV